MLAPGGLLIAILLLGLEVFAAWSYRGAYVPMLHGHTLPTTSSAVAPVTGDAAS